jgi:hypothetical protein
VSEQGEYDRYVREGQAALAAIEAAGELDSLEATTELLEAQVHATLALAAATAWGVTRRTTPWAEQSTTDVRLAALAELGRVQDEMRREASGRG